jgi:ATP-dependent protease ClpP protease subunit
MGMTIYRDNLPVILIDRHIGQDALYGAGITGADFVRELNAIENSGYHKCEVWINSIGGSVMDGMDIYNSIINSKIEVNTRCVGIAASISGIIFQAGKNRIMNDYALLMMHNPSGGDDKALNVIKDSLVTMLATRCSKSDLQISNMMEKETWLDSSDCKEMGLCDEIDISIEVEKQLIENKSPIAVYNKLRLVVNKLIEKPKVKKMKNVMNALNLTEDANEESVLKEVNALKDQIESLTASVKEKEEALNKIKEDKEEADKNAAAVEAVEAAVKEGRIEETAKDSFVALAKLNLEGVKNTLSKMPVRAIANRLPLPDGKDESRASWTYSDWEKKDGKGLENMYKNSRPQYDLLLDKYKQTQNIK